MIAYRSNIIGLPVPAPRPAAPVDGRKGRKWSKGKAWDEEELACLQAFIAQGLTPGAAARRMGRKSGSACWALEKLKRRQARAQAAQEHA